MAKKIKALKLHFQVINFYPFDLYIRFMIEPQFSDFSKSPEDPEDIWFLFVRIFLKIKLANLGCGSIHQMAPNGQITELEKIGEL